ncbi:hypothetical protein MKW92_033067 [Papaver armeniacum]|nr:hypothetical protein MKW92_033067 [Papaver armeniacum]
MSSAAVQMISKETIKPKTPTPYQLRNFNLSLIDQYMLPNYVPIILFYAASVQTSTCSKHSDDLELLKRSLSETLVLFYPMAGRMKDNIMVDCNDEGIEFIQVNVKGKMGDFMMKPHVPLSLLLPSEVVSMNLVKEAQVIVQVNMFDCGGTAICLCISHKIADAYTMSTFIRNWAGNMNTARCGGAGAIASPTINKKFVPSFDSASLFPLSEKLASPSGMPPTPASYHEEDRRRDKTVIKRFVFDAVKITSLREKLQELMHGSYICRRPTRVEVVSALLWKAAMRSAPTGSISTVYHVVNFRNKMDPPLPDVSFGNICLIVAAALPATTAKKIYEVEVQEVLDNQLTEFVARLRGAINKVKGDKGCIERIFLNFFNGNDASIEKNNDVEDEGVALWMTSWCKFGLYAADFGWGKPIWVTTDLYIEPSKNIICMNDTKCGEGIEVWAKFPEDDMTKFENHLNKILELI